MFKIDCLIKLDNDDISEACNYRIMNFFLFYGLLFFSESKFELDLI